MGYCTLAVWCLSCGSFYTFTLVSDSDLFCFDFFPAGFKSVVIYCYRKNMVMICKYICQCDHATKNLSVESGPYFMQVSRIL